MENKRNLAVASIRRSSKKQEGNNSFQIQIDAIKKYAENKGYYLPDNFIFYDDGVSAFKTPAGKRKGLNQMKEVVLAENIQAIIFYDFSRIDRKVYSFVSEFYNDVIEKKPYLKFYTTTNQDEWTPADLDVKLQLLFANAESVKKARQAIDGQITVLSSAGGKRPGAPAPYGYRQTDKVLFVSDEAPIVLFIFHLAAWGHSSDRIATLLNDAGIPTPKKKNNWQSSTIDKILHNPVYMGNLDWNLKKRIAGSNKFVIENNHAPIVPYMYYRLIEINRGLKKIYNKLETPFLFAGLLTCNKCGDLLEHRNASTKKNSKIYSYLKYMCCNCSYDIDIDSLNSPLLKSIQKQLAISLRINTESIGVYLEGYLQELKRQIESLNLQEQQVLINEKIAIDSKDTSLHSIFRNVKSKLKEEQNQLESSFNKIQMLLVPAELEQLLASLQNFDISKMAATEQRVLLLYFIRNIVVDKNKEIAEFDINFKINPVSFLTSSIG